MDKAFLALCVFVLGCPTTPSTDDNGVGRGVDDATSSGFDMGRSDGSNPDSSEGRMRVFDLGIRDARPESEDGQRVLDMSPDVRPVDTDGSNLSGGDARTDGDIPSLEERPLDQLFLAGTHNSYSGGTRASVIEQLDRGVRVLEFDVHLDAFRDRQDWILGHVGPGHEVALGAGNPDRPLLTLWLETVARWSTQNMGHAPIILMLDSKSWLSQADGPEDGNLGALNRRLYEVFGARLYPASAWRGRWPSLRTLRDRVVVVLSGNTFDRQAYQRDQGREPAVGTNGRNQVIELHSAIDGGLWYWTGQLTATDDVQWWQHRRYDTGREPAVAIRDDGIVIDIHRTHTGLQRLWSAVGQLRADYSIDWSDAQPMTRGSRPSVRLLDDGRVQVFFLDGRSTMTMFGQLNDDRDGVRWGEPQPTDELPNSAQRSGRIEVTTRADEFAPEDTLQYRVDGGPFRRIVYTQLMHTEYQSGDRPELQASARVFATGAGPSSGDFTADWHRRGLVRIWSFDAARVEDEPLPQLPCTDTPFDPWYDRLMVDLGAIDWRVE